MKKIIFTMLLATMSTSMIYAQFSRLHIKTPSASTIGITSGTANKIIGISHDGSSGTISTTTLNGATDYSPLKFCTSGQVRMTIFENGFVGIGVSGTPTAELTVAGKVHAREVKVNVSAGADYVFLEDYKLLPLSMVSRYIKQNHHLPDVPAASEMEKDGMDLSQMNILLLRKVEELTLYLIDQDTKMKELTKELAVLREELAKLKK